jgi:AcrR family transcriptional regulator
VPARSFDEIRREAEVSVGALYHHSPDRAALAAAVYAEVMGEYQHWVSGDAARIADR